MAALPTIYGYTVDLRLREFRRADPELGMEFIPFDSPEGQELLFTFMVKEEEQDYHSTFPGDSVERTGVYCPECGQEGCLGVECPCHKEQ